MNYHVLDQYKSKTTFNVTFGSRWSNHVNDIYSTGFFTDGDDVAELFWHDVGSYADYHHYWPQYTPPFYLTTGYGTSRTSTYGGIYVSDAVSHTGNNMNGSLQRTYI